MPVRNCCTGCQNLCCPAAGKPSSRLDCCSGPCCVHSCGACTTPGGYIGCLHGARCGLAGSYFTCGHGCIGGCTSGLCASCCGPCCN